MRKRMVTSTRLKKRRIVLQKIFVRPFSRPVKGYVSYFSPSLLLFSFFSLGWWLIDG
jgi:hypothetical protein